VNYVKNLDGKIEIISDKIKEVWRKYTNEENAWDKDTTCEMGEV